MTKYHIAFSLAFFSFTLAWQPGSALADAALNKQCDEVAGSRIDVDISPDVEGVARGDIEKDKAIPACEAALKADPENAHIMFNLGRALEVTETDPVRATQLYQKAAEKGSVAAMVNLGRAYELGNGITVDMALAVKWTAAAADKGLAIAQDNLANYYRDGNGVARDYGKALELYEKADAQGYAPSTVNLGYLYDSGFGVAKDLKKAADYYQKAIDGGETLAMNNLAGLYSEGIGFPLDLDKARTLYQQAVDEGDIDALSGLGDLYDQGAGGLPVDHAKANELYKKAIEEGNDQGKTKLGENLIEGQGVDKDVAAGLKLLEEAFDAENSDAAEDLAKLYLEGKVVTADVPRAASYYLSALQFGNNKVYDHLISRRGDGLPPELIDLMQKELQAKGKSFDAEKGRLSDSAIEAMTSFVMGK